MSIRDETPAWNPEATFRMLPDGLYVHVDQLTTVMGASADPRSQFVAGVLRRWTRGVPAKFWPADDDPNPMPVIRLFRWLP